MRAVLVTDAESRNKAGAPGVTFAHCNAHIVRKLREAAKVQPVLAREGRTFLDALYDIVDDPDLPIDNNQASASSNGTPSFGSPRFSRAASKVPTAGRRYSVWYRPP